MMIILAAPEETNYQMQKKIGIRNVKGIQCEDMDKTFIVHKDKLDIGQIWTLDKRYKYFQFYLHFASYL